jgi:hypothetical protein
MLDCVNPNRDTLSLYIVLARSAQRLAINRFSDPCPECGVCNEEWKGECIHVDRCPNCGVS